MFTGLITHTGSIQSVSKQKLVVRPLLRFPKLVLGESIAVDGCCLTLVRTARGFLEFDLSEETLAKTKMHAYKPGMKVNLERALRVGQALGGHFVQGHVDGVGAIVSLTPKAQSLVMGVSHPKDLRKFMIEKGSVAVDGISLTLSLLPQNRFQVHLIPHTVVLTNLKERRVGDLVNLEADMLGKYVVGQKR